MWGCYLAFRTQPYSKPILLSEWLAGVCCGLLLPISSVALIEGSVLDLEGKPAAPMDAWKQHTSRLCYAVVNPQ